MFRRWSKVNSYVPGTHCPVKNLDVGKQYEFRVVAENQYGVSEPLTTTEPITAKHPFGEKLYTCILLYVHMVVVFTLVE